MQTNHAQWHVDKSSSRKVNAITKGNNEELTSKVDELIHMLKGQCYIFKFSLCKF
jgi:hypothetical protein